jgi:hypothetical protein
MSDGSFISGAEHGPPRSLSAFFLRHRHVKAIECHRDKAIEPDQVDELGRAAQPEGFHSIAQFNEAFGRSLKSHRSGNVLFSLGRH